MEIFSFDIFDTIVSRAVSVPADLFRVIHGDLVEGNLDIPQNLKLNFASIRMAAEASARGSSDNEDITLREIYLHIGKTIGLSQEQTDLLMDLELDYEGRYCFPISWTVQEIQKLRAEGKTIIFTSDMYLPLDFIKKILQQVNAYKEGDPIYLSGEVGLTKASGNLFKFILEQHQCDPENLVHFGDNLKSDLVVPYQLGLKIYQTPQMSLRLIAVKYQLNALLLTLYRIGVKLFRLVVKKRSP